MDPQSLTTEIPTSFYLIVGVLVVTNVTAIIALITFIFKCGEFVANTKSGIKDAKDTGVRAHQRIDRLAGPNLDV